MLDEVSVMLTSANMQLSRKHCSSHVGLGQSLDLQTDQQALLPPPLLVRLQQHLVELQLTMMMTCTTNHMDALAKCSRGRITMSVFVVSFSALQVLAINISQTSRTGSKGVCLPNLFI